METRTLIYDDEIHMSKMRMTHDKLTPRTMSPLAGLRSKRTLSIVGFLILSMAVFVSLKAAYTSDDADKGLPGESFGAGINMAVQGIEEDVRIKRSTLEGKTPADGRTLENSNDAIELEEESNNKDSAQNNVSATKDGNNDAIMEEDEASQSDNTIQNVDRAIDNDDVTQNVDKVTNNDDDSNSGTQQESIADVIKDNLDTRDANSENNILTTTVTQKPASVNTNSTFSNSSSIENAYQNITTNLDSETQFDLDFNATTNASNTDFTKPNITSNVNNEKPLNSDINKSTQTLNDKNATVNSSHDTEMESHYRNTSVEASGDLIGNNTVLSAGNYTVDSRDNGFDNSTNENAKSMNSDENPINGTQDIYEGGHATHIVSYEPNLNKSISINEHPINGTMDIHPGGNLTEIPSNEQNLDNRNATSDYNDTKVSNKSMVVGRNDTLNGLDTLLPEVSNNHTTLVGAVYNSTYNNCSNNCTNNTSGTLDSKSDEASLVNTNVTGSNNTQNDINLLIENIMSTTPDINVTTANESLSNLVNSSYILQNKGTSGIMNGNSTRNGNETFSSVDENLDLFTNSQNVTQNDTFSLNILKHLLEKFIHESLNNTSGTNDTSELETRNGTWGFYTDASDMYNSTVNKMYNSTAYQVLNANNTNGNIQRNNYTMNSQTTDPMNNTLDTSLQNGDNVTISNDTISVKADDIPANGTLFTINSKNSSSTELKGQNGTSSEAGSLSSSKDNVSSIPTNNSNSGINTSKTTNNLAIVTGPNVDEVQLEANDVKTIQSNTISTTPSLVYLFTKQFSSTTPSMSGSLATLPSPSIDGGSGSTVLPTNSKGYRLPPIHGLYWEDREYVLSTLVPVICGIVGAAIIVCLAYIFGRCKHNRASQYKSYSNHDVDQILLLEDGSDEEK